jgi:periplasmic copper chaperone A
MKFLQYALMAILPVVCSAGSLSAQTSSEHTIAVANAWARATPAGSTTAVVYMTLVNSGKNMDRLLGGATPVAEKVRFHSNINDNGVMRMRELDAIDIAPGASVLLKPGSTHAMMIGLKKTLREGQSFVLSLEFEKAGKIDVVVSIGKIGAMEHHDM